MNNTVRIQISLHLDDPVQKHAFEVLNNLSRSARRQYVCNLIRTNGLVASEDELAELIAQKVSEKLAEKNIAPERRESTGKKRGRPPKTGVKTERGETNSSEEKSKPVSRTDTQPAQKQEDLTSFIPKQKEILPDDDMLASMSAFVGE